MNIPSRSANEGALTDHDDMIIQLPLVLGRLPLRPVHLGDLRNTRKNRIDDLFIPRIHLGAHRQVVCAFQVRFDALDKCREMTNEERDAFAFPHAGFCIVDDFYLLILVISYRCPRPDCPAVHRLLAVRYAAVR